MATRVRTYSGAGANSQTAVPFGAAIPAGDLIVVAVVNNTNGSTVPFQIGANAGDWTLLGTIYPYNGDKSPTSIWAKVADGSTDDGGSDGLVGSWNPVLACTFMAATYHGLGLPVTDSIVNPGETGVAGGMTRHVSETLTVPANGAMIAFLVARCFGGNAIGAEGGTTEVCIVGSADWPGVMGEILDDGSQTTELYFAPAVNSGTADAAFAFPSVSPDPWAGVLLDVDASGDFDPTGDDDISTFVTKWVISRGASAEITGGSQPGTCILTVKNTSNRFNPYYASGPFYGNLRDGMMVWVGPNADGALNGDDPRGLFGGRVTDITLLPSGGADDAPLAEISCEDMLSWARRSPVQIDYGEGRSQADLRALALVFAGESRYELAHEIHTMPLSHADSNLATVLDDINAVNGTRHWAKPEDLYADWFTYTTHNRFWRLDGSTVDGSLSADSEHVTDTDGWRQSADTVINRQKATVTPIKFTPGTFTVWQAESLPFNLTPDRPFSRIVEFDDVVRDPLLDLASIGDAVIATFTPFAAAAKIELSVAPGDAATITGLSVEGRLARRLPDESYTADDIVSQAAPRGVREGGQIGNEYLGVIASARGIAQHVVWRYGNPQLRPTLTVVNWLPDQFDLDLYDVIAFTSPQLKMTDRLFEIVGLTHEAILAASADLHSHTVTYILQESRLQEPADWFLLDDDPGSLLDDGVSLLHY